MPAQLEVPALPIAYIQALQLLREPDAALEQLEAVATGDAAFTVTLLRLANSAQSSPVRRVSTARDAIVRLGLPQARRAIIGVTLRRAFRGTDGSLIDERELWRHLIAVGILAEAIASGGKDAGEGFTAGLLHDVGRLAMASEDPRRYAQVVQLARRGIGTDAAERHVFGMTHELWGVNLGRRWGFPDPVLDAISDHHDGHSSSVAWVVARSREFASRLGIGDGVLAADPPGGPDETGLLPVLRELGGRDGILLEVDRFSQVLRAA